MFGRKKPQQEVSGELPKHIKAKGHVNDVHPPVTLLLFHPVTGEQADDFRAALDRLPAPERKAAEREIEATKKAGGMFYWIKEGNEWGRVELLNYMFASMACGRTVTVEHNFPMGVDRFEWLQQRVEKLQRGSKGRAKK